MSDYKVLAEVGQSLINVLWEGISADADLSTLISSLNLISLESPAEHQENAADSALLSVYLYRITEDPFMKNRSAVEGTGGRVRKPPMALDLFYLITPLLKAPRDQQIVLGKIMQIFYDHPTLEGPDLPPTLRASGDVARVIFNPVPLQEVSWIWQALETPYRLSVSYSVRVSMLDSTDEQFQERVIKARNIYGGKKELVGTGA
jgi:hypothetical protein